MRSKGDFITFVAARQISSQDNVSASPAEDNEVMSNTSTQALPADIASSTGNFDYDLNTKLIFTHYYS